ncbi:MAG: glycosyltransferase family 9 protein [candidate division Zixibacteria bacterium]|nr:glycosyltransferase family 9 protein [candidate division Zixibacteria bacterium]
MSTMIEVNKDDKLLVSRTDRLGDLVLALPFIETLSLRYPGNQVDVIASLYASPILENNPRIHKILRVQNDQLKSNSHYRRELLSKIIQGGYRAVIVLYPERQMTKLFTEAGIPIRIGTAGRMYSLSYTHRLLHSRKGNRKHEYEYNLDFLRYFKDGAVFASAAVYPTEREIANARRLLLSVGVTPPFIIIHPGSGGSAERWPLENYIQLYNLLKINGHSVVMTGSSQEREKLVSASAHMPVAIKQIAGETDVRTLAAVLSLAEIVVSNSTGPLHLAAAVGTKVVGLYPNKSVMSPLRWGPVGEGHVVIQPGETGSGNRPGINMESVSTLHVLNRIESQYKSIVR